jgi:uncharacterized protein (TIGR03435 family)
MRRLSVFIVIPLVATSILARQTDRASATLEAVSIKPLAADAETLAALLSAPTCGLPLLSISAGRIDIPITTLCGLVRIAYNVTDYQVQGTPTFLARAEASNYFHVEARVGTSRVLSLDEARPLIQRLLVDRFALRAHRSPAELPAYALTVAKGGPKWNGCVDSTVSSIYGPGRLLSCTPPLALARVTQMLTREVGRPVVDKTGLSGTYSFELHWLPDGSPSQPDSPPTIFTAIQEQLGLKLESQRLSVDTVVLDHAERPTPN